ncbi:hypothetical protein QBC41DRAFT_189804, partial [Cercophora samala]
MRSTLRRLLFGTTITQPKDLPGGSVTPMFLTTGMYHGPRTDSVSVLNHRSRASLRTPDPADRWWGLLRPERHLELSNQVNKLLIIYSRHLATPLKRHRGGTAADRDDSCI